MAIKFHTEEEMSREQLTLEDVECDQFFIDDWGRLCQKYTHFKYNVIADTTGTPVAYRKDSKSVTLSINKVLPKVIKITWE